jgi:hypothetical protein
MWLVELRWKQAVDHQVVRLAGEESEADWRESRALDHEEMWLVGEGGEGDMAVQVCLPVFAKVGRC